MAPVPEDAFRSLLTDTARSTVAAFVAELWRARGFEVAEDGDRLLADGRELRVVDDAGGATPPEDGWLVATTPPTPSHGGDGVVGPADLRELLLYDVPRERAAELFERHFDRPLDGDWSDGRGGSSGPLGDETAAGEGDDGDDGVDDDTPDVPAGEETGGTDVGGRPPTAGRRTVPSPRALVRDRRLQVAALALLLVGAVGAWGLAVHEPAPATRGTSPLSTAELTPVEGSFRAVTSLQRPVSGEQVGLERTQTYSPESPLVVTTHTSVADDDGVLTVIGYRRGTRAYSRTTYPNESQYAAVAGGGLDPRIVRRVDSTRTVYRVERETRPLYGAFVGGFARSALAPLPYERGGTTTYEGIEVVRYVPQSGWARWEVGPDRFETYRVRAVEGEVLLSAEEGALLYADVEATLVRGDTWGDALAGEGARFAVEYRVEPGAERPEAPPWVEALRATVNASG